MTRPSSTQIVLEFSATCRSNNCIRGLGNRSPIFIIDMKRVFILLWTTAALLTVVVAGSVTMTDDTKYRNDFIRLFPPHFLAPHSMIRIESRRFPIAGLTSEKLYLQDRVRGGLLIAGCDLIDTMHVEVQGSKGVEVTVDSPWFFLHSGYLAEIRRGNLSDWSAEVTFGELPGFTLMQPISKTTAILRTIDMKKRKSIFMRSDFPNAPKDILKTQVDGILCTDGFLQYCKEYNRLIYTYCYRNQFLSLDTMLNIQLIGKTIDTTNVAKISVAEVNGEIKMSKPPLVVNKSSCVDRKYLFVHSNLKARNESIDQFKNNSVVDVYNVLDGHYVFSFHIENIDGTKMQSFRVIKDVLVAIFPGQIVQYRLNPNYLP